ncbi:MAG: FAD-dependent oxidoreductase [Gammaproteobacteria bacterium]
MAMILRTLSMLSRGFFSLLKLSLWGFGALAIATTVVVLLSGDPTFHHPRPDTLVNDVTQLNPIHVATVVRPGSVDEVVRAIRSSSGPISIGGGRYSQGGQTAYPDSLHLDMRSLADVLSLDAENRRVTVQAGITWRALQEAIDPENLSIRIMQTYANFTVGGSISVNVHGRYIGEGPLVRSLESMVLVLADGSRVRATPDTNQELFNAAVGGYGGIGVIVEATLRLDDNVRVERVATSMPFSDYPAHFADNVRDNDKVVFHNADLYPPDYDEVLDVSWYATQKAVTVADRLRPADADYVWQPRAAAFVAGWPMGLSVRKNIIDPLVYRKDLVAWRNWEASYDVAEIEPRSRAKHTYVLREYFVPVGNLKPFVTTMREIFQRHDANILNVSIRHALPDENTFLSWAPEEVFALVVYYRQRTDRDAQSNVGTWSREMIDAVIEVGGTYYLPYQVHATAQQFDRAYPRADEYFAVKARVDPQNRLRNSLWQQHNAANRSPLQADKALLNDYWRGEEQSYLTVPEWYLVFNPLEYAQFLEAGNDPNAFGFFASIDEYWTQYDRVREISRSYSYPHNGEYITMLRVIGISTTAEFLLKGAYEATVGRLTRWVAAGKDTPEDELIARAHRAYSDLIFAEAWYEFDFAHWVGKIWRETDFFGDQFIRGLERKLFFTLEFGAKHLYAKLIGAASKSTYGEQSSVIYLTARPPEPLTVPVSPATVEHERDELQILSIPRWGPFTDTLPVLLRAGYEIEDISGNQKIVVSLLTQQSAALRALPGSELFRSPLVSDASTSRVVWEVSVADLRELLVEVDGSSVELEHVFDY